MSTSQDLQVLYSLDSSSPDFSRHLCSLIRDDEKEQYLTSLQGSELACLVGFLDQVRTVPPAFDQFTKQIPQALSVIPTADDVGRECLDKLQAICGHNGVLPSSCIASGEISRAGDDPVALSVIADVWEGTYDDKKVFIKTLRVRAKSQQSLKEVRVRYRTSLSCPLNRTCGRCSYFSKRSSCGNG